MEIFMFHENKILKAQNELYSKLTEAASEIERGENCVDAEMFLKELMEEALMKTTPL